MAQTQKVTADAVAETKKRHRVDFAGTDAGVDPKDCITIYLVSSKEEVDGADGFCFNAIDLSNFFEEDGKIYGYQGLKISVWMSIISFRSFADITFESKSDGGKGITDLTSALKNIFGVTLLDNKDDFLESFSREAQYIRETISTGVACQKKSLNGYLKDGCFVKDPYEMEVIRLGMSNIATGHLYSRLVPLVLLLVDGSNPIDVTDPGWEIHLLIMKKLDEAGNTQERVLGFSAIYRFYHHPDGSRLRLGQILVLPPYQQMGFGRDLIFALNMVALQEEAVYDITIEEPLEKLQHLRTCNDCFRILHFVPVDAAIRATVSLLKQGKISKKTHLPKLLPPPDVVEEVRKTYKINKKQFLHCWDILVYVGLGIDNCDDSVMDDFFTVVANRMRADILGKDSETAGKKVIEVPSEHDPAMSFVMFRSGAGGEAVEVEGDLSQQEEQLKQLVNKRIEEIKLLGQKVVQIDQS